MPGESGVTVVTTLVCFTYHFAREAAGALGTRHSPRPLSSRRMVHARLGRIAPRDAESYLKLALYLARFVMPGLVPGVAGEGDLNAELGKRMLATQDILDENCYREFWGQSVPISCGNCGAIVPQEARECPVCSVDVGYPNVRYAERPEEQAALKHRADGARSSAAARGALQQVNDFAADVGRSFAVMNRSIGTLHSWLNSNNPFLLTFHQQVRAGMRVREQNAFDHQRTAAENTISPSFFEDVSFSALSLDNTGLTYYGAYCVRLKEAIIRHRASVFEENPFIFCRKHAIISGQAAPAGYRATWDERSELAVSKLVGRVNATTTHLESADILMEQNRNDANCDFIETHIYGKLHHNAIEHVTGPLPSNAPDKVLWKQIKQRLTDLGAGYSEL